MKLLLGVVVGVMFACSALQAQHAFPEAAPESTVRVSGDHQTGYTIIGFVAKPGLYQFEKEKVSIYDAFVAASGPAMCETCFKVGGEALLWKRLGGAIMTRGAQKIKVPRGKLYDWFLKPGDIVFVDHIAL